MHLAFGVLCIVAAVAAWPASPPKGGVYVSSTYPQGPCQPNHRVKYQCNDCYCDRNGLGYTCSRRECGNERPTGPQISPPRPFPDGPQVQPPRPNPGGPQVQPPRPNPGGPQVQPPRPNPDRPQIQPTRPPRECTPGTSFLAPDGCNTCRCTSKGVAACTRRLCSNRCTPGTTFKSPDGCNTCTCTSNGTQICTQRACFPVPPPPAKQ